MSAEQIKSWYSGRDGLDNKITRNIDAIAAEAINTPTSGKLDKKTFIMPDGTTYSMTKDGFTSETKDKKTKQEFIDQKAWENLLSTIDKETMKKMKPDNATLSGDFQTWLDGNTTTNTGAQTPPANDNTQPNSSSSNNQP